MRIVFASMDEVPEHLKNQVKTVDGQIVLEGDGADGILAKNKELLENNRIYKEVYDKWKDLKDTNPAQAKAALEQLESIAAERKKMEAAIQSAVQENSKTWEAKVKTVETERETYKTSLEERIIDADLTGVVTKLDGDPFFVVPKLRGNVKAVLENGKYVAKVIDPKTNMPRLNAKGEQMTLEELAAEAKADKQFSSVFKAPAASGSGTQSQTQTQTTGSDQVVRLTREQATNAATYREAMTKVGGDATRIQVEG
jgi:hypothetical protein